MNDCEKIQEMISAMLDGELSASQREAIEQHIVSCPECAAMYADFAALSGMFEESLEEVPAGLHSKIMKGVRVSQKPKKPLIVQLRPYMSAAACLVVLIGAVFTLRGSPKSADSLAAPMVAEAPAAPAAYAEDATPAETAQTENFSFYGYDSKETELAESGEAPMLAPAEPAAPADSAVTAESAEPAEPAAAEPAAPMEAPADTAVEEPAEDAGNDMAEEECADDLSRDMPLYGYAAYEPGTAIDEAWYIHYSSGEDFPQMQRILFPELLRELLAPSEKQTELDSPPTEADAIVRLRCGEEYTTIKLHFTDGLILVETSGSLYTAVGSPEEFLSINDYTIG